MTGHGIARVDQNEGSVTLRCECGTDWRAHKLETAEGRWGIHVQIEAARAALKGDIS